MQLPTIPAALAVDRGRCRIFFFALPRFLSPLAFHLYGPGSFSDLPAMTKRTHVMVSLPTALAARVTPKAAHAMEATVMLPEMNLAALVRGGGKTLVADITVAAGAHPHGSSLEVYIDGDAAESLTPESKQFAGSLQFFGRHHHMGPVTFELPVEESAEVAAKAGLLGAKKPMHLELIPHMRGVTATEGEELLTATDVSVKTL